MSVIQIRQAKRAGARVVINLSGPSGSGKTRTALEIALGLANFNPGKIGFLDTENKRGSLYADVYEKHPKHPTNTPFLIGDLYPPFSPARYVDAILAFQKAGVEVLIVDSGSHEWEGDGGAQDIAEEGNPKLPNWNRAKEEHKKFVNALLQCDMHIIVCLRAREKSKPEKQIIDGKQKTVYVDMGLQPICEKNFMYEMTTSIMMHDQGTRRDVLKCPADLQSIFSKQGGYLGAEEGKALRDWIDGGESVDAELERHRNILQTVTEKGVDALAKAWTATPTAIQNKLGKDFKETLKHSAEAYDQRRKEREEAEKQAGSLGSIELPSLQAPSLTPIKETQEATNGTKAEEVSPAPEKTPPAAPTQAETPSAKVAQPAEVAPHDIGDVF